MANLVFTIKTSADLKPLVNTRNEIQSITKSAKELLALKKQKMDSIKSSVSSSELDKSVRLQQAQDRLELARLRERRQQEAHITTEKNKQLVAQKKQLDIINSQLRNERNLARTMNPLGPAGKFSGFGGGMARGLLFGSTSIFTTGTMAGVGFGIGLGTVNAVKTAYQKLNDFVVEGIELTKTYEQRWVSLAGVIGQFNNTTLQESITLSKKWTDQLTIQASVFNVNQEEMHQTALAMSVVGSSFEDIVKYGAKYAALIKLLTFGQPFERQIGSETRASLGTGTTSGAVLLRQQQAARGGSVKQIQEQNALLLKQGQYWRQLEEDMAPVMKAQEELRKTYEAQLNLVKELGNIEQRNLFSDTAGGYKALIESISILKQQRLLKGEQGSATQLMMEEWISNPSLFKNWILENGGKKALEKLVNPKEQYPIPGKYYDVSYQVFDTKTKKSETLPNVNGEYYSEFPRGRTSQYTLKDLLEMNEEQRLAIQARQSKQILEKTAKESGALPTIDLQKLNLEKIKQGLLRQSSIFEESAFSSGFGATAFDLSSKRKSLEYSKRGMDYTLSPEYKKSLSERLVDEGIEIGKAKQRLAIEQKLIEMDSENEDHIKNVRMINDEIQTLESKRLATLTEIFNVQKRTEDISKSLKEIEKQREFTLLEYNVIDADTYKEKISAQQKILDKLNEEHEAAKNVALTDENRIEQTQKIVALELDINRELRTQLDYKKSLSEAEMRTQNALEKTKERVSLYRESLVTDPAQMRKMLQSKMSAAYTRLGEFGTSPQQLDRGEFPNFGEDTDKQKDFDDAIAEILRLHSALQDLRSPIQAAAADMQGLVQSTLQGFSQIIMSGQNMSDVLRNLFSNIVSSLANMGISMMMQSMFPQQKNSGFNFLSMAGSLAGGLASYGAGSGGSSGGSFDYFTGEGLSLTPHYGMMSVNNNMSSLKTVSMNYNNQMPVSSNQSEKEYRSFIKNSSGRGNWFDRSVTIKKPKDTL